MTEIDIKEVEQFDITEVFQEMPQSTIIELEDFVGLPMENWDDMKSSGKQATITAFALLYAKDKSKVSLVKATSCSLKDIDKLAEDLGIDLEEQAAKNKEAKDKTKKPTPRRKPSPKG